MSSLTIPPFPISPRDDAIQLYRAFKGFGCDTAAVVNILGHRDVTQRALIQQEYRNMYSEDINKRLSSELSGNTKRAVLLWMQDPAERDATIMGEVVTGDIVDLAAATEIICSRTPTQIRIFRHIYQTNFGYPLDDDVELQMSGHHQQLLLAYMNTVRYEGPEVDHAKVEKDAKALYKSGEKKLGTEESTFIEIFSERSRAHLAAVSSAYHHKYGNTLEKAVKSETSGKFGLALLTILRCAQNPAKYFAKILHKAMEGMGTNDTTLIRVVVTRAEMDMQYIKVEYQKKYGKSLRDAIKSETSGNYKDFLLSLVGPSH